MALTKQGVRNLDTLPGKSAGKRLDVPPQAAIVCKHKSRKIINAHNLNWVVCTDCKESVGDPW